ncbi:protein VASCULATURE COMPLEXITY AND CONNECTIVITY-like [Carex rostrata]
MAKVEAVIVCILIILMDVVAGILGLQAEKAQNHGRHLKVLFIECKEPVHQAYRLGIAAAVLLALSHVIANLLGGCTCICSRDVLSGSSANRRVAAITLVISWLILGVGFALLIIGALSNKSKSRATCGFPHHNFLSVGGILCFIHGIFCLAYFVSANAANREDKPQRSIISHGVHP